MTRQAVKAAMTSRERITAAIRWQPVDHVPLYINTFGFTPPPELAWADSFERSRRFLALGLDDLVDLYLAESAFLHPDVKVRHWRERDPQEALPILCSAYETPAGTLRQRVRQTADYPFAEIPLMNDFNVPASRSIEYLVKGSADLPALRYLFGPPSREELARIRDLAAVRRRFCDENALFFMSYGPECTDALVWLCGVENLLMKALDEPAFVEELHDIMHAHDRQLVDILSHCGVDMIVCRGWYDTTELWSPELFRRFAKPRIAKLTELAHTAGVPFGYAMSTGMMPLLDDLAAIGYDLHIHVDPVKGRADLRQVRAAFAGHVATLGGLSAAVTLNRGSAEEIRRAVREAVDVLGPTGLILSPVDCLFEDTRWSQVETLIQAWRETW